MSQSERPNAVPVTPAADAPDARAKHLRPNHGGLSVPDLVPARMINEVLYCERLMYLEWVQREFEHNEYTEDGKAVHRRVDRPGKKLPPPPSDPDLDPEWAGQIRSVWLSSERLGITAKIDVVDLGADGRVAPVEHKRGKRPNLPEGAWPPERAQLCSHVLLLRDHGYRCEQAFIYYAKDRQRVEIAIDQSLIDLTLTAVELARGVAASPHVPRPLSNDPRCNGCSLVGICLPDEVELLHRLRGEPQKALDDAMAFAPDAEGDLDETPWFLAENRSVPSPDLRRLHPARDDKLPLYVQEQGARIGLRGERLTANGRETQVESRLPNTSHVAVFGNVQVTTQALSALLRRGIPLMFFSGGGWYIGRTIGAENKNVGLRSAQFRAIDDAKHCLLLARQLVATKILNCRTMLRRNAVPADEVKLKELKGLARKAGESISLETLLGIEGTAARVYFSGFTAMLKGSEDVLRAFDYDGRNRRPPRDPLNAMLSFCYALLTKDWVIALTVAGLDPLAGFFHQPRFGKPALALDLMEEFRPIVADSVVVTAINNGVVTPADFAITPHGTSLSKSGRRRLIHAYERRMDQLVTHPVFGYRISYRRVLEVQARLMGRLLTGEVDAYPAFRTR